MLRELWTACPPPRRATGRVAELVNGHDLERLHLEREEAEVRGGPCAILEETRGLDLQHR